MNLLIFVRLSLLVPPIYIWIISHVLDSHYPIREMHSYIFLVLSFVSLILTCIVDQTIRVECKHTMNISLMNIIHIICGSIYLRNYGDFIILMAFMVCISLHTILYFIVCSITEEKYKRYYDGLPLFTEEEKKQYLEVFINNYIKKNKCKCEC